MIKKLFKTRFSLYFASIFMYTGLSTILRVVLLSQSFSGISSSPLEFLKIFLIGFYFDFAEALIIYLPYLTYLILFPKKLIGGKIDIIMTYFIFSLTLFLVLFGLMGEIPFWDEFHARYNFIAVDYLIYTYEVVQNINESYPIPWILTILITMIALIIFAFRKWGIFTSTYSKQDGISSRLKMAFIPLIISFISIKYVNNDQGNWSENRFNNELSKNGELSFFAAFRSNQLDYNQFYKKINSEEAIGILDKDLSCKNTHFNLNSVDPIERKITDSLDEIHPNIVLITIESLSAEFLGCFGNQQNLTPFMDSLSTQSIFFSNLYATGTRTVRGMEALTLCVPPTPGHSIVRRPNNENLYSIASVLRDKDYSLSFLYGGDGYFDNMNYFFGSQGFKIVDRNRGNPLSDNIDIKRQNIPDEEVSFENAWGVCDQDIYFQSLKEADENYANGKRFFQFIMTTSNHRPFTYPSDSSILNHKNRDGAVNYTDFALKEFIQNAKSRPWFANTVFVIVADHCASSAGKWELNIDKHHIPAFIFNLKEESRRVTDLCSQIDLMPTLFGYLHWSYDSRFFGMDVNQMDQYKTRAFIANYRTLGFLKGNILTQLNDKQEVKQFDWNSETNDLQLLESNVDSLQKLCISYYQVASQRFKEGVMKD